MHKFIGVLVTLLLFGNSYSQEAIAIHPLKASGIDQSQAQVLTDAIRAEISHLGLFAIMERSEMDNILKEQGFQASGACDDDACALEMGKILAVRYMVLGSVGLLGKTYSIGIRLVDVGTGKIVRDKSEYYKGEIDKLLTDVVPSISRKLVEGLGRSEKANSEDSNSKNAAEVKPKKKKGALIAGVSLGVAAAAGAVTAVVILSKDDDGSSEPTETDITISWE